MARNLDSYTDEHRPRRRTRRQRPYHEKRDDDFERDPAGLGLDELRRARSEYYSRPEDERMRARSVRHMAQEVHVRERERDIAERSRERRADSRRREWRRERDVVQRKKKKEPEEDEGSEVYVYGRPREVRERREPRSVRDTSPSREQRRARRPVETVRVSRVRAVKRNGDTMHGVAGSSRRIAEEEPDLRSRGARSRQESRPRSEPRAAPRSVSIRLVEAPKLNRSIPAREAPRVYMTRPSLKRSNTTARVVKIPVTAPPSVRPSRAPSVVRRTGTPGNLSATPGRRSSGLLATLFKPSPSRSAPTIVQKAELKVECIICMADDLPASKTAKLSCGHRMCYPCLKRQFALSVNDPQHMPPTCCSSEHIPLKYVERLFDDKFKKLWNQKYKEYTTKDRLYCPMKGCGEWVKPSSIRMDLTVGRKYAKCGRCRTKVCVLCNGIWHIRKDCPKDEETKQIVQMAKQKGWQRCYNCKTMVELKEGCNHMTCRCTAQFCMLCAAKWKTCNCPWFNYSNIDNSDRINEMRVHQNPTINIVEVFENEASWDEIPRGRGRNHTIYASHTTDRRVQERADEALAAHLQAQLLLNPTPTASEGGVNVQVFSLGNAGSHHLNESYTVRYPTTGGAHTAASNPPPVLPRVNRRRTVRERVQVEEEPEPAPEPAPVNAAVMAGLAKDGSRRGAARVGPWLQHVELDPAELEARRTAVEAEAAGYGNAGWI